ncbi:zinc ABC transporter substrate-binding protein [Oceanobacillus luteolus]|uniref:Metal ABC transporter solute-binding protein, Zn/Mn family n=1 Tax=Oceanobacillus luteolus TaxID=1274358 RepID=A0ABW4HRB3_9BACI|nr:zinc ABC transporter substrate-binding protein [Oceanobacillus luteolus]
MKILKGLLLILSIALLLSGCGNTTGNKNNKDIIYTTIYPLQYLVKNIAGDLVDVQSVYPPGVDEHTYEPTAKDLTDIAEGKAFFYIGAGLEALASTAANALENQDVNLIEIGSHQELFLPSDHDHESEDHDHEHSDFDPHIWLDPIRMIEIAEIVKDELVEIYPEEAEKLNENLETVQAELQELHEEYEQVITQKQNKQILVTHAAFGYWEDRYDLEQIAIHGISTENEPSQKDLIAIVDTAQEHGLEYIIFEQNVTTRTSEVIQKEIDAEVLIIHNLAVLTDEDIAEKEDYLSIMRENLQVLDKAMD